MKWVELNSLADQNIVEFNRLYKCLNVNRPVTPETLTSNISGITKEYEAVRSLYLGYFDRLTKEHRDEVRSKLAKLRDRLVVVFGIHKIKTVIPLDLSTKLDESVETIESDQEESVIDKEGPESDNRNELEGLSEENKLQSSINKSNPDTKHKKISKMVVTAIDFTKLAAGLIPEFDGTVSNLQSFLDALAIIDAQSENHGDLAAKIAKTKLKGNTRQLVTDEDDTIEKISNKLRLKVKGESSLTITSKIGSVKQNNKTTGVYTSELEGLTKSLKHSLTQNGMTDSLAEEHSTQTLVRSVIDNATNPEIKLIMRAGQFKTIDEVIEKLVGLNLSQTDQTINYYNSNRGNYRGNNRNRGRGSRGGGNYSNFPNFPNGNNGNYYPNNIYNNNCTNGRNRDNSNGFYRNFNQNRRGNRPFRGNYNNPQNDAFQRGHQNNQNIRVQENIPHNQGNQEVPEAGTLGEIQE